MTKYNKPLQPKEWFGLIAWGLWSSKWILIVVGWIAWLLKNDYIIIES